MKNGFIVLPQKAPPAQVIRQFTDLFTRRGWLNRNLRIQYRGKKYRIFCSEKTFIAYRINEYYGISPGMPGWTVCIVNCDQVLEDASLPNPSDEPTTDEWLRCLTNGEFETI